jgi:hypothetical protein
MKSVRYAVLSIVAATGLCSAQGPHGPAGGGMAASSTLNMAKAQTITGVVAAVNIGYGMQYPSITVNKAQIKIAPVWYLLDKGFELRAGDLLAVLAAPSTVSTDPYLYAVEMTNTVSKLHIVLRDSAGLPLWAGRGNSGNAGGPMAEGGCIDTSSAVTVAGKVEKISMGAGIEMPTLTLKTADGKLLVLKLGPERILLAADLELKAGDAVTVKYAIETCTDELVALAITTASGVTITLRGDDCLPAWR